VIIYLTYNDQPSGVYWSQVTDVVAHLNTLGGSPVRLVALVSLRRFWATRRAIRAHCPGAVVWPMVPHARNWRLNSLPLAVLFRWLRPSGVIARGVFAAALGLRMRRRGLLRAVCFDARTAYAAEWEEFPVVDDAQLVNDMPELERTVLNGVDLRIAVSHALVDYWRERHGHAHPKHLVIPCTWTSERNKGVPGTAGLRARFGWGPHDVVLVYSGTVVGWQSMEHQYDRLREWLAHGPDRRVLFLSAEHATIDALRNAFPAQVERLFVPHEQVHALLSECDHGLMLRHECVTNRVASPTKFAEYLGAGLPVIISDAVGDLSALVRECDLGTVLGVGDAIPDLERPTPDQRRHTRAVAEALFTKAAHNAQYKEVLRHLDAPRTFLRGGAPPQRPEMRDMLVSIVVPGYNKVRYLDEMIASVQAQTHTNWEMLFVDDCSTDGTREAIVAHAARDPRIRPVLQEKNAGANRCRNLGVEMARGEHLMFLDADDVLAPHCLEHRLAHAVQGDHDMVVAPMEVFHRKPGDGKDRWAPTSRDPLDDFLRHDLPWQVMQPLWRRSFVRSLGGFDERFARHQDVEFHTNALFRPDLHYGTIAGAPDCFYRIDEDRKVLRPYDLLNAYTRAAVLYYDKFRDRAVDTGRSSLLFGTIYRTYVQILHGRKVGWVDDEQCRTLIALLMTPAIQRDMGGFRRRCFRASYYFNTLPVRIRGVNMLLYHAVCL
jgi:glycosyltransferase involved in cell wall biosynthesis